MSKANFELHATSREDIGKGASRRLRRTTDSVPAVLYGGHEEPKSINLSANELRKALQHEAFYSHILTLKLDGKPQQAVVKAIQRHPSKPFVMHMDLMRISAKEKIIMRVPLHFMNEQTAPGVKLQGGIFSHIITDIEIKCLPADLPEFIEVDAGSLELDESIHLSELKLPKGVEMAHAIDEAHDSPVVSIHLPRAEKTTDETDETASASSEAGEKAEGEKDGKGKEESSD